MKPSITLGLQKKNKKGKIIRIDSIYSLSENNKKYKILRIVSCPENRYAKQKLLTKGAIVKVVGTVDQYKIVTKPSRMAYAVNISLSKVSE